MLSSRTILFSGAVVAGLAVAFGAFGAHALQPVLAAHGSSATFALAAQYQFFHALALLLTGLLIEQRAQSGAMLKWAAIFFFTGILFFSGSLYILALTGSRAVVLITPAGGLFFLIGWGLLAAGILKRK